MATNKTTVTATAEDKKLPEKSEEREVSKASELDSSDQDKQV